MRPDPAATAALGARLITFDRPGFGQSDAKPGRSLTDTADDIVALIDHLDLDKVYVAAASGGGPPALAFAHRAPDRIRAVALIGAAAPLDAPGALAGIAFERRVGFWLDQTILARSETRQMFLASYAESLVQGVDAFAWEVQLAARSWGFSLSDIRVPIAVWHGGKDNSIPPEMGKRIAAAIPGAQMHLLPDESHLFFLSRWREILGDLLSLG
jgi:pimeloyl-ACP methyl ester carboxylesterase